jgi:hypothetical protein
LQWSQPYAPAALYPPPPWSFLSLISFRGWVDPRAIVRLEGLAQSNNPMTSSGIESVTFQFVTYSASTNYTTACPSVFKYTIIKYKPHITWLEAEHSLHVLPYRWRSWLIFGRRSIRISERTSVILRFLVAVFSPYRKYWNNPSIRPLHLPSKSFVIRQSCHRSTACVLRPNSVGKYPAVKGGIFDGSIVFLSLRALQASLTVALPWSRSCDLRLQFLKPIVVISPSIECSHLTASLPTRRVPCGLCRVNFLQGFCSYIMYSCPSHLNHPTSITLIISRSLSLLLSSSSP